MRAAVWLCLCPHSQTDTDREIEKERKEDGRKEKKETLVFCCYTPCWAGLRDSVLHTAHSTHLLFMQRNLNCTVHYFLKHIRWYTHKHTHTHCTYTLYIHTQGLCGSLLEMQLIPLSGQISNSNLTIDLYILSVINHTLCSLNKSNNAHTYTHTQAKKTLSETLSGPYHPTTHTHMHSTQYGCIMSFIYL